MHKAVLKHVTAGMHAFLAIVADEYQLNPDTLKQMWERFNEDKDAETATAPRTAVRRRRTTTSSTAGASTATPAGGDVTTTTKKKRGMSAYNLFCKNERAKVLAEHPEVKNFREISKILGSRWKKVSDADKAKLKQEIEALRAQTVGAFASIAEEATADIESETAEEEIAPVVVEARPPVAASPPPASPAFAPLASSPPAVVGGGGAVAGGAVSPVSPPFQWAESPVGRSASKKKRGEAYSPTRPNILMNEFRDDDDDDDDDEERAGTKSDESFYVRHLSIKTDKELRAECKKFGIPKDVSRTVMIERLARRMAQV